MAPFVAVALILIIDIAVNLMYLKEIRKMTDRVEALEGKKKGVCECKT